MNIYKARKKTQRIRRERTLLFIYAVAVTGAFLVSVYNNNTVKASIPADLELSEQMPEEFYDESYQDIDEDLKAQTDLPEDQSEMAVFDEPETVETLETTEPQYVQEALVVQKGDSFINILTGKGLNYGTASQIYGELKKVYDAKNIRIGQTVNLSYLPAAQENQMPDILQIMIEPVSGTRYIVEKGENDRYQSRVEQDELVQEVKVITGTINGNVSSAMSAAGVPNNVIGNFINIFSFSVDFRKDVKAGDRFEVRYERQIAPNGKVVKTGEIVYAALQLGRDKTELYRFKDKKGHVDYYDEKGLALKKNLDRKPMEFKRARISSRFGRRFHPILKTYRDHHGVDYAAPSGSKVYASGDGVIKMAKWYGGYGNFISIRHNSEYTTGYGHLKSFAKGIRPGVRVKQGQLIAYVGNTGRSTGPHLHFEVVRNGRKVDPLKVKAATGENLTGEKLKEFKKTVAQIKSLGQETKSVADNSAAVEKTEKIN